MSKILNNSTEPENIHIEKLFKRESPISKQTIKSVVTEEHVDTFIVIPPDGGWGWIIVMGAFISFLISDGIICTFGIFLQQMSDTFNCSKSQVSLIGAIMTGVFCVSGPGIAALVNQFGYRKIAIIGSFIASASCALTALSSSLYLTLFTHGILGGLGFGLIYVPAVIAVGFYFERWRALATGIAVCGTGIGGIIFPPTLTMLLDKMGWQYTFGIMACATLVCAFTGLLYRPIKPTKLGQTVQRKVNRNEGKLKFFERFHNKSHPTIADIHRGNSTEIDFQLKYQNEYISNEGISTMTIYKPQTLTKNISSELLMSSISTSSTSKSSFKSTAISEMLKNGESRLSTVFEEIKPADGCCKYLWPTRNVENRCKTCFCTACFEIKNVTTEMNRENYVTRPLYRDDIFYNASLAVLPEYRKSSQRKFTSSTSKLKSTMEYSMHVTRTMTIAEKNDMPQCVFCSESIKRTIATMLDISLLKSYAFLLLALNAVFTSLGFYTPYMFIKDRAIQCGISESHSLWLISFIGISNTFGRIGCGILSSFSTVPAFSICYVSLFMGGLATALYGLSCNVWVHFGYAAVYGASVACISVLRTVIIVEMLGLEKLTNAIGIILMCQGVSSLIGTSISGFLLDITGDYVLSFYFAGGCIGLGSIFLMPIKAISAWENKKYPGRYNRNYVNL